MIPHPQQISSTSPQEPPLARRSCSWAAMALGLSLLSACGGGGGGGSTPSASSSVLLTAGAVTGFGSVVVDGTEIEDAQAKVLRENADGSLSSDLVQLGQRVRVKHDERGQASQITVDAALIGVVSAIDSTAGTLRVAAQNVSINSSSALGPVTVFGGGYADLSNVSTGDLVEIHGTPVYSTNNASYSVQATRIAKAPAAGAKLQISGKISGYASTAGGASFTLNGLTVQVSASSALRPAGSTLADGLQVTAFSSSTLNASTLTASHIRVDRNQDSANVGAKAQLSGVATGYDATANTLVLGNTLIKLAGATVTDLKGKQSTVQNGAYVLVGGSVNSDGSVTAGTVKVRTADTTADLAQVLLIGPVTDFVDAGSFVVRGVPVDASNISWATACPGVSAAADVLVKVQALQQAATNVVKAQSLSCTPTVTTQVIRSQEGAASAVDLTAKTFTLTLNNSARTVQWNEATSFLGLVAPGSTDTVGGKSVYVDGYLSGNTLVARVVRLDDDSAQAPKVDGERFRKPRSGLAPQGAWTEYRKKAKEATTGQ